MLNLIPATVPTFEIVRLVTANKLFLKDGMRYGTEKIVDWVRSCFTNKTKLPISTQAYKDCGNFCTSAIIFCGTSEK